MFVMTDRIGVMMLVQSSLPPKPTSITAMSTLHSSKYLNAIAVVSSKKLGCNGSKNDAHLYETDYIFFTYTLSIYPYAFPEILYVRRCI